MKSVEMIEVNDLDKSKVLGVVGGRYIVHHMGWRTAVLDEEGNEQRGFLQTPWPVHEVGRNGDIFDPRAGPVLRANSVIYVSTIHLHSTVFDTTGHIEMGFRFHEKGYEPEYSEVSSNLGDGVDISIRPNSDSQELHAYETLNQHTKIVAFEPHLHAPGKRMCLEAIWGGEIETLSCVGYDHNWVRTYVFEDHAAPLLPKGTILHVYAEMDNSPTNINVADPRNWQGSGNRTASNMFLDFGRRVYLTDEHFLEEMAERRQALNMGPNDHVIGCPLCTAALVSPIHDEATDTGWLTIAGILSEINQFPNDAQRAELMAIANDDASSRPMQAIARSVARIDHTANPEDIPALGRLVSDSSRFPKAAGVIASVLLEFDDTASADAKAMLKDL